VQIATTRRPDYYGDPAAVTELAQRVHVLYADTSAELLQCLRSLEALIITHAVRLIVMDSVASLARKEFNSASLIERTEVLATQAAQLKCVRRRRSRRSVARR